MAKGTIPGTVLVETGTEDPRRKDDPSTPGIAYLEQLPGMVKARDVYGGTDTMQAAGTRYLAQFPVEEDAQYVERLAKARLYNMFRATVDGLTDMVWRKPLKVAVDVPPEIDALLANLDLQGRSAGEVSRAGFREKIKLGHVHYFVDWHSPTKTLPTSQAGEKDARPYVTPITKDQLVRFRPENRGGRPVLTVFAYVSTDVVADGDFAEKEILRTREYALVPVTAGGEQVSAETGRADKAPNGRVREQVRYRSWTRDATAATDSEWAIEEAGRMLGPRMTEIPLVTDYGARTGFMTSDVTLSDLVEENIEHYQVRSERKQSLGIAGIAVMCLTGVAKSEVETVAVGSSIGLVLPAGADGKYLETTGAGLDEYRKELQDIEQRATSLGLSMLQQSKRVAETATAHELDRAVETSKLGAQADATSAALLEVLRLCALWLGLDWVPDEGSVEVNTDFDTTKLSPELIKVLSAMVAEDQLSIETLWDQLVIGEILPQGFDAEEEASLIEQAVEKRMSGPLPPNMTDPVAAAEALRLAADPNQNQGGVEGFGGGA